MDASAHQFLLFHLRQAVYFDPLFLEANLYENYVPAVTVLGYAAPVLTSPDDPYVFDRTNNRFLFNGRFLKSSFGRDNFIWRKKLCEGCTGKGVAEKGLPYVYEVMFHCDTQTSILAVPGRDQLVLENFRKRIDEAVRGILLRLPGGEFCTVVVVIEPYDRTFRPDVHVHVRIYGTYIEFLDKYPFFQWRHAGIDHLPKKLVSDLAMDFRTAERCALKESGSLLSGHCRVMIAKEIHKQMLKAPKFLPRFQRGAEPRLGNQKEVNGL